MERKTWSSLGASLLVTGSAGGPPVADAVAVLMAPTGLAAKHLRTLREAQDERRRDTTRPTEDFLRLADQYARIGWEKVLYGNYTRFTHDGLYWWYG